MSQETEGNRENECFRARDARDTGLSLDGVPQAENMDAFQGFVDHTVYAATAECSGSPHVPAARPQEGRQFLFYAGVLEPAEILYLNLP